MPSGSASGIAMLPDISMARARMLMDRSRKNLPARASVPGRWSCPAPSRSAKRLGARGLDRAFRDEA